MAVEVRTLNSGGPMRARAVATQRERCTSSTTMGRYAIAFRCALRRVVGTQRPLLAEHPRARGNEIPVIAVSAFRKDPLIARARAAGALRVLTRPFHARDLLESIESAIGLPR